MKILLIFLVLLVAMIIPWGNIICQKITRTNVSLKNLAENVERAIMFDGAILILAGTLLILKVISSLM